MVLQELLSKVLRSRCNVEGPQLGLAECETDAYEQHGCVILFEDGSLLQVEGSLVGESIRLSKLVDLKLV